MTEPIVNQPRSSAIASTSRLMMVVCLIAGAVAWTRLGPDYIRMLRPSVKASPDFYQEWGSARNYRLGLPVYTSHAVSMPIHLHRPQADWESDIQYNAHPPVSVVLAMPFSGLELPDAVLSWNLVTLSGLMVGLLIVAGNLPELRASSCRRPSSCRSACRSTGTSSRASSPSCWCCCWRRPGPRTAGAGRPSPGYWWEPRRP